MKKAFTIILLLGCFAANAQIMRYRDVNIPKRNAIKTNILSPLIGTLNICHEYLLDSVWSVQNGFAYTSIIEQPNDNKKFGFEGFQYTLDVRMYKSTKQRWNGWYNQFFLRFGQYANYDYKQDSSTANKVVQLNEKMAGINLGVAYGYQRVYQNKFVLDVYGGIYKTLSISYNSNLDEKTIEIYELESFKDNPLTSLSSIRLGLKVGYLF